MIQLILNLKLCQTRNYTKHNPALIIYLDLKVYSFYTIFNHFSLDCNIIFNAFTLKWLENITPKSDDGLGSFLSLGLVYYKCYFFENKSISTNNSVKHHKLEILVIQSVSVLTMKLYTRQLDKNRPITFVYVSKTMINTLNCLFTHDCALCNLDWYVSVS